MNDQTQNLNPHKFAVAAMWIFRNEYSQHGGGSMDFWQQLPDRYKEMIFTMVRQIEQAPGDSSEIASLHFKKLKEKICKP